MPIFVTQKVTCSPTPAALPKRIELKQVLRSQLASETITVDYTLAAGHDIWFEDDGDAPSKTVRRTETLDNTDQEYVDRVKLVRGQGQRLDDLVQIDQTLTDSFGITTHAVCVVRLA